MKFAIENIWKHPRTTLIGLCSFFATAFVLVQTDPSYAAIKSSIPTRWAGTLATLAALASLLLRMGAKDTGREEAKTADGGTTMTDSHETPNSGAPPVTQP